MSYTLSNKELATLKGKLKVAVKNGDSIKIIATVQTAMSIFEAKGYPDCWHDWQRAKDDAEFRQMAHV